jgi:hypothetical protein
MKVLRTWLRQNAKALRYGMGYITWWEVRAAVAGHEGRHEDALRIIRRQR